VQQRREVLKIHMKLNCFSFFTNNSAYSIYRPRSVGWAEEWLEK